MRFLRSWNLFRDYDWVLILISVILAAVGLSAIYSVDLSRDAELTFFPTQALAFGLGLVVVFILGSIHLTVYQSMARVAYVVSLILLILVLFFGVTIRGTTGWFRIAGFSFQPAEFAKAALILFLPWWIHLHGRRFDRWQFVFTSGFLSFLPALLILLQPDAGSAFIVLSLWFGLLLLTGTKKRYIALLVGAASLVFVCAWLFAFQPYQKDRLRTFMHPEHDPLGAGYNVVQSIIAVGAGELFGRGLGFGSQSQLHFLPEAQTDFIFSVIAEELGFVGVSIVILLYLGLLARLIQIAVHARNDFAAYTVVGIALLLFIHLLVNVGGAIGMLPLTGVTLPFLSYGGTSLLISFSLIGIATSVARSVRFSRGTPED